MIYENIEDNIRYKIIMNKVIGKKYCKGYWKKSIVKDICKIEE